MTESAAVGWREVLVGRHALALSIVCLGISLHAINVPLTATILPTAVKEIGGLDFLSWTATIYLVASILTSVNGALVQRKIGMRRAYTVAALIFALGSLVCASAHDMWVMLVGRGVQGCGGGLILALGYAAVRRLFPEFLWAKIFALISGIWGACALLGAFVGGLFADFGIWRGAYAVMLPIAVLLIGLAWLGLPRPQTTPLAARATTYPGLRLLLVCGAVLAVATSGNISGMIPSILLVFVAVLFGTTALRLDQRAPDSLMPAGAFSFRSIVGNGLWMAFALMLASYAFAVYGPVLLQTLHGVPATMAGGFVALQSFSWTVAALAVAALGNAPERGIIVAGPITMLVGLFGLAFALSGGPFWVIPIFVFCQGAGIGMCWAFVCKRIMSFALDGDGDIAAAAIPTTQMFGMSFGAALAGVVANAFGFSTGLTAASAASVAQWLHASFALAALVALIAAVQLVRLEVRRRPQGPLS